MRSDPKFLKSNPIIVLFVFFIKSVSIISIEFSNLLISEISLKISEERNDGLKDLINNGIGLMLPVFQVKQLRSKSPMINLIVNESIRDNNLFNWSTFYLQGHWMERLSRGRHAIYLFEVPFKRELIELGDQFKGTKLIHLKEISMVMHPVLSLNKKLSEKFRRSFVFR